MTNTQTAKIKIRSACQRTVHIATLYVGRKAVYETRAWGTAPNAWDDAKSHAQSIGVKVSE